MSLSWLVPSLRESSGNTSFSNAKDPGPIPGSRYESEARVRCFLSARLIGGPEVYALELESMDRQARVKKEKMSAGFPTK